MLFLLLGVFAGESRMEFNELNRILHLIVYQLTLPMQLSTVLGVPSVRLLKGTIKQMTCFLSHGFKGQN